MEIKGVVRDGDESVKEDDLQEMPYLKAMKGSIIFMAADMGWDPNVWEDPMAFKPGRFLNSSGGEASAITGRREIKMMPIGVGRS
ncbi:hypothetical protein D5086_028511 [Populus alba]|uniref:Uncharacterized protein n=1 Tax=Populus alba TaxID=43335 RepID=A0ACC4AYU0_POPAL